VLRVAKPSVPAIDAFRACYMGAEDVDLASRLHIQEGYIQNRSDDYEQAANAGTACSLAASDFGVPNVSKAEMGWLYDVRMVKRTAGRVIYETLRAAAHDGLCCICGVRPASTLDHFLAKNAYHSLAVNPLNLIPACFECNHGKGSGTRDTPHPYFDDFHLDVWLDADVVPTSPCAIKFSVKPPNAWSPSLATRVDTHFREFELGGLYASQAGRHLAGNRQLLRQTLSRADVDAVQTLLEYMRDSWAAVNPNCWEAAMYRALAASQWYCSGGFDH
jgi:hypothetical protein